jgi:secondary thiamine-phosphate synthase enzyme
MSKIIIESKKSKEIIDITDLINKEIDTQNIQEGLCMLFIKHTTAALTTADLDPGTDQDYLSAFDEIIPKLNYRHPHDPDHVKDHILSSIIGSSLLLSINNGKLNLGTWQRVILVELSGPRDRELILTIFNS